MRRYREYKKYKEIDERYVKGRKVDVHKRYVKYHLYKATKIMEIDTSERKLYLEKHFKKSNLKDRKSETKLIEKCLTIAREITL